MNIGITGATGLIGARIIAMGKKAGHTFTGFTRDPARPVPGCFETRKFSHDENVNVDGCDAIIHLAGEPVAGIWTKEKRRRILESRTLGTRRIADAIRSSKSPPRVLVNGSAIGCYGDTGEVEVDEDSPPGSGFLTDVVLAWEHEALQPVGRPLRVVLLRTAIVLGRDGGALKIMLPAFKAGLGGPLGTGRQWMSWIHLDDEAALALYAVENEDVTGPLNATAPQPCRNEEFTRALAHVLHRPAFFRVPAFVLRTILGDFSRELLDSKRVLPRRTQGAGFQYRFPSIEGALRDILNSSR